MNDALERAATLMDETGLELVIHQTEVVACTQNQADTFAPSSKLQGVTLLIGTTIK